MLDSRINPVGKEARNPRIGVHTEKFGGSSQTEISGQQSPWAIYGYSPDGKKIPDAYLVSVTSLRNRAKVVSPLQESISLFAESSWQQFLPSLSSFGNLLIQAASGGRKALVTKATSRRIWNGTSPIKLSVKMVFEAVNDTLKEVVYPIMMLSSMILPAETLYTSEEDKASSIVEEGQRQIARGLDKLPLLGPPGPSPFSLEGIVDLKSILSNQVASKIESLAGGDHIMIEIGRFLTFDNVIIKSISPVIPIKFDSSGYPISASMNINFETYEMITVESFQKAFTLLGDSTTHAQTIAFQEA